MEFQEAKDLLFQKLAPSKIMALASSVNDYVMVRNVSCLIYNEAIYFKTDKNFRKTKQLYENPHVALCVGGIQVLQQLKAWLLMNLVVNLKNFIKSIYGEVIMLIVMKKMRF